MTTVETAARTEHIALFIKQVDESLAQKLREDPSYMAIEAMNGVVTGTSLRLVLREAPDGRRSVALSMTNRIHRRRASGKLFHYWFTENASSLAWTKAGQVIARNFGRGVTTRTEHVFDTAAAHLQLRHPLNQFIQMRADLARRHEGVGSLRTLEDTVGVEDEENHRDIATKITHEISTIVDSFMGQMPSFEEHYPMIAQYQKEAASPSLLNQLRREKSSFRKAQNWAEVAKNAFGKTRYRRPLVGLIQASPETIEWFRLFRGLVPIEWIIDAMRRYEKAKTAGETESFTGWRSYRHISPSPVYIREGVRLVLRACPKEVLARILKEEATTAQRTLLDAAKYMLAPNGVRMRDHALFAQLLAAKGQRSLRGSRDVEGVLREMPYLEQSRDRHAATAQVLAEEIQTMRELNGYNRQMRQLGQPEMTREQWADPQTRAQARIFLEEHRRELPDARERAYLEEQEARRRWIQREAERAAWAEAKTEALDGAVVKGHRVTVASTSKQLSLWGAELDNCIGGYSENIGLDLLIAVHDPEGKLVLNIEINQRAGIRQFLAYKNRDALRYVSRNVAKALLALFAENEIVADAHCLGLSGLR